MSERYPNSPKKAYTSDDYLYWLDYNKSIEWITSDDLRVNFPEIEIIKVRVGETFTSSNGRHWTIGKDHLMEVMEPKVIPSVIDIKMKSLFDAMIWLQEHIKNVDVSVVNVPVGFSFMADGKLMVKYSLSDPICFHTVEDTVNFLINAIDDLKK